MFQPYEALYDLYAEEGTPWRDVCRTCGMQRILHPLDADHWFEPVVVTPVVQKP